MSGSEVAHPVYPVKASAEEVDRLRQAVAPLMATSEADLVALVPDRTGFLFMGCPACDEGTQEGQLVWSVEDPRRVKCRYCGTVYPNEKYPEDRALRVINPVGIEVVYPYWEDETGYRYFFSAKAWRQARVYFAERAQDLGMLYQATGDRRYARRAALILDAFARHYPGFLVSRDRAFESKGFALEPPYPTHGGKWGRWVSDEMPSDCVMAYDAIYDSKELERLSEEAEADVRTRIENDFFLGAIRQERLHPPTYDNMSSRIYRGYALIGRVLGDPALVHEAVRRSQRLFACRFFVDGLWCEGSLSYHRAAMQRGIQRVFEVLKGYSDPPGYVDPESGERFEDLDLARDLPAVTRAYRLLETCRYPDGRLIPVHDAWAGFDDVKVLERSVSTLLAGAGHAWLGYGAGEAQAQVHLHFSGGYGHEHEDNLSLILFAKGHELFSDVGYTHTRYRRWSASALCHNTVLIDEQQQYIRAGRPRWDLPRAFDAEPSDGQLLAFEPAFAPVQWMEASAERAYPGLAEIYRRMVMLVEVGEGEVYAVDLFRVKGGSQHDWVIHGSADRDGQAAVSVPTEYYGEHLLPGIRVRYPAHERDAGDAEGRNPAYAFFQNVHRGTATGDVKIAFSLSGLPVGVRTHLVGVEGSEVFLGDAPSIRRAEENEVFLDRHRMPIFLARRRGASPLSSCFVAVHEPYEKKPFVEEVQLELCAEEGDAIVLSVKHHGVMDYIVHRTGPGKAAMNELRLRGEVGFVRDRDSAPVAMGLWGGTELRWRDHVLRGSGVYEGEVRGVLRSEAGDEGDALVVTGDLPEGDALKAATVIVRFGDGSTLGYRVKGVKRASEETHLALESDPGVAVDKKGARHLFFPLREVSGPVTYRIRTSAFATQVEAPGRGQYKENP